MVCISKLLVFPNPRVVLAGCRKKNARQLYSTWACFTLAMWLIFWSGVRTASFSFLLHNLLIMRLWTNHSTTSLIKWKWCLCIPYHITDVRISVPLCVLSHFSHFWLFGTPWIVAHQDPLSMGFSRQEYWRGLPLPSPGDLLHPGTEPASLAWQANSLTLGHWGSP